MNLGVENLPPRPTNPEAAYVTQIQQHDFRRLLRVSANAASS